MEEGDKPFIFSSWRNHLYYSIKSPRPDSVKFFKDATILIQGCLDNFPCLVACMEDVIIGYYIDEFMYIKKDYRNQGIEEELLKGEKK